MSKVKDAAKPNGAAETFNPFSSFFTSALNGNKNFMGNAYQAAQQQMLDFTIQRLRRTEKALEDCKACKDPITLISVQQKWFADTMKDYFEQSARLGDKMQETASGGMALASKTRESVQVAA